MRGGGLGSRSHRVRPQIEADFLLTSPVEILDDGRSKSSGVIAASPCAARHTAFNAQGPAVKSVKALSRIPSRPVKNFATLRPFWTGTRRSMVAILPRIRKITAPTTFHLLVLVLIRPEPVQNSGLGIRRDCPRQPLTHGPRPGSANDPASRATDHRLSRSSAGLVSPGNSGRAYGRSSPPPDWQPSHHAP